MKDNKLVSTDALRCPVAALPPGPSRWLHARSMAKLLNARIRPLVVERVIVAAAIVFAPLVMSTSIYSSLVVDVVFAQGAASLSEMERQKVVDSVERIRKEDWCTFEVAIATGHADTSEGGPADLVKLSQLRAAYVANIIRAQGIPAKQVYEEGKGDAQPLPQPLSSRVEVLFKGGIGGTGCKFPKGPGGFRVWN